MLVGTRVIMTGERMTPRREQGTHRARVVSHPAGGGPSGCSACAGDNEEGALLQARRPVAHARSDGDDPADSRHASRASDTAPSSSRSRSPAGSPGEVTPSTVCMASCVK